MAKRMNGTHSESEIKNLTVNGSLVDTNEGKAELFAITFSDISSNKNHNDTFLSHKNDIELNLKELFENSSDDVNNNRLKSLNEPFDLH